MRGDLLFYPSDYFNPVDRAIAWFTKGPFVHVAVDMGDGTEISAHSEDGIQRRPLNPHGLTVYCLGGTSPSNILHLESGIAFLTNQIGKKYGYANILNNVLYGLGLPWRVYNVNRYDCSSLVAHYLEHCGIDLSDDDEAISPNDLARALGILKK